MEMSEAAFYQLLYCLLTAAIVGTLLGGVLLGAGFRKWNQRIARQRSPRYLAEPGLIQSSGIIFSSIVLLFFVWLFVDYGGLLVTIPFSIGLLACYLCWSNWFTWKQGLAISASYIAISLLVVVLLFPLLLMLILKVLN